MIVIYPCRFGTLSIDDGDNPIHASLKLYGEWGQNELDFISSYVKEGSTVVSAGAHVGSYLLALSTWAGKTGKVFGFEPQSYLYDLAKNNIKINELENIELRKLALGSEHSFAYIVEAPPNTQANRGATSLSSLELGTYVQVVPFDSYFNNLTRLDLIHLDIEGSELKALLGMVKSIQTYKPVILLENLNDTIDKELGDFLSGMGYTYTLKEFSAYNPNNFLQNTYNMFGGAYERSVFATPLSLSD